MFAILWINCQLCDQPGDASSTLFNKQINIVFGGKICKYTAKKVVWEGEESETDGRIEK